MNKLVSFNILSQETPASSFIPYSHHVTNHIISTKNAEYLSIWRIGGRSHQSSSQHEVFTWINDLNNLLRGIATANISFWTHIVRRRVYEYPESKFENNFCRKLDEDYRASFTSYNLMVNDLYLTVIFRPVADKTLSFFASYEKESLDQKELRQTSSIKALEDINRSIDGAFKRYNAEILGIYEKDGHAYSSALEFLAFLVNNENKPIPVCRDRFANYMTFNRPLFSIWGEIGEIRKTNATQQFGMLEITDYDETTEPGQLNILLESDYEFVLTQSFSAFSRHAAKDFLERHKQHLIDAKDAAYGQIQEIDEALNQLISGKFVMGEHHGTLMVFGNNANEVQDHLAKANTALLDVAIISKICDLSLEAAFWSQLPANFAYRPRPKAVTSLNFLSFSPFHNFMSGKPIGNPWGAAVTILKTISGTPLYFNFHASPLEDDSYGKRLLGNTMFIGKSGSGKTVLLGFLLAQTQKYNPTIIAFDKDRGMEIAIRAMDGKYLPLKKGVSSGFNPFQLEPTPYNLSFLKSLIKKLASSNGEEILHSDEEEIDKALNTLMFHIDKPLRRLSTLLQGLPNPMRNNLEHQTVHARLTKWCEGGELGWLFDNPNDELNLESHKLYGFDMTEFLNEPEINVPTIMYLLFRTEKMIDGNPFIYCFDEFWRALENEYLENFAKDKEKTIRKENGIFIFATQEPGDVLESHIARTLVQQFATYIFLANPSADYKDYVEGFKLTESEFNLITNLGEDSRRFLIKQGDNSVVAELNLTGFDDELLVLSGTPDNAEMVTNIIAKVKDENPNVWLPIFLENAKKQKAKS